MVVVVVVAADWTERINQIRENPVLHPQTAAKNTAIEAAMIHGDCAFNLPKLFLITIIIISTYLFIYFDSVCLKTRWRITGISAGATERLQPTERCAAGFCLIRPHTQWDLHADAGHVGVYYAHHGK